MFILEKNVTDMIYVYIRKECYWHDLCLYWERMLLTWFMFILEKNVTDMIYVYIRKNVHWYDLCLY